MNRINSDNINYTFLHWLNIIILNSLLNQLWRLFSHCYLNNSVVIVCMCSLIISSIMLLLVSLIFALIRSSIKLSFSKLEQMVKHSLIVIEFWDNLFHVVCNFLSISSSSDEKQYGIISPCSRRSKFFLTFVNVAFILSEKWHDYWGSMHEFYYSNKTCFNDIL